ncbi:polysaccharide deacetylase family protein [Hyphomicrobium sp. 99]|uniref:polysaccharide deacetylase family protein n=1 Tax=Hyphomicrobium sp. 99 TaxID=1163419 RepID=UPI0005F82FB3|nr:polysaccharide deacetylase family protein [Hyphomicrobium sp. 99]
MFVCRVGLLFGLTALLAVPAARAADDATCPRAGTLGVSRTVEIDTTGGPGFGMDNYKAYDFLQDKEILLTFDDGPQKYTTEAVLKALGDECVKATFFSIGKMALGYPEIIREVAKAGHTVGTHTWSHKSIAKLKTFDEGKDEIERGVSGVRRAVGGPVAPFFRFPTLADTPEAVAYLGKRNIAMFSTDIDSFDFKPQTADHLVKSLMQKIDKRGKGIILMHDIHKTTAKAVPMLLAELKAKGYKIVHMTAKFPVTTVAEYDQAIEKEAKGLPQVGAERPVSSIVKTIDGPAPAAESATSGGEPEGLPPPPAPDAATTAGSAASHSEGAAPALPSFPTTPSSEPAANSVPGKQSAVQPMKSIAETSSPPSPMGPVVTTTGSLPAANATVPPTHTAAVSMAQETASPVKTVSAEGEKTAASSPAAPMMPIETAPQQPTKSISQRVKDAWEYWFGQ